MAFNVMARNCDDHTKNIAFLLKQGGWWELAPAYDMTHAYNPLSTWKAQHLMSVNGRSDDIRREDLLTVADRFVVPEPERLLAEVATAIRAFPEFAAKAALPADSQKRVERDFSVL